MYIEGMVVSISVGLGYILSDLFTCCFQENCRGSARNGHHSQAPLARALLELHSALVALIVLSEGVPKLSRGFLFGGGLP